jgi:hypothetical protein
MFYLFDCLPLDLKFNVIQHLDYNEVVAISETCDELHCLANDTYIWEELFRYDDYEKSNKPRKTWGNKMGDIVKENEHKLWKESYKTVWKVILLYG